MAAEGAKTEVWMRRIRSVNMIADWLHDEKEGTVKTIYRPYKETYNTELIVMQ